LTTKCYSDRRWVPRYKFSLKGLRQIFANRQTLRAKAFICATHANDHPSVLETQDNMHDCEGANLCINNITTLFVTVSSKVIPQNSFSVLSHFHAMNLGTASVSNMKQANMN